MPDDIISQINKNPASVKSAGPSVAAENARRMALANKLVGGAMGGGMSTFAGYVYGKENQDTPKPVSALNTLGGVVTGGAMGGKGVIGKALGGAAGAVLSMGGERLGNFIGKLRYKSTQEELPFYEKDSVHAKIKSMALPTVAITSAGMGAIANHAAQKALAARRSQG